MSSSHVRNKIRQWAAAASTTAGVPFHETINVSVNPSDAVWFTVSFTSESHEGNFCKSPFIENGFVTFTFIARPGIGDAACLAALESVIPLAYANTDAQLTLINYEPIDEDSFGSADKDYRMTVNMNYRLSL